MLEQSTLDAAYQWLRQVAPDAPVPALTPRSAIEWCRALGRSRQDLRRFWPSAENLLVIPSQEDAFLEAGNIRKLDQVLRQFFLQQFGQEVVTSYGVAAGFDVETLIAGRDLLRGRLRDPALYEDVPPDMCPGQGLAYSRMILICWLAQEDPGDPSTLRTGQGALVYAHELTHILQQELAMNWPPRAPVAGSNLFLGPLWLVEGHAMNVADQFWALAANQGPPRLTTVFEQAESEGAPLSEMRDAGSFVGENSYRTAALATFLLGARHGSEAMFAYFREVGRLGDWDAAFETVFEQDLAAFQSDFEELRRDIDEARSFAKARRRLR